MNEIAMLHEAEPRKILEMVAQEQVPAIMTYLSGGKWRVAKVLLIECGAGSFSVEISPNKSWTHKPHPMNIRLDQPVGISIKYGYGKFIFETSVLSLKSSPESTTGGAIVLAVPNRIELVQRRSYFRVDVPESLKVNVVLWHRGHRNSERHSPPDNYWESRLLDISAGGAQLAINSADNPDFRKGQFIGLRFTPMPYETPLMFDAQIRSVLPTADGEHICIGLQIVGLEASTEGRQVLSRIVSVVERYHQINQSSIKQQDMEPSPNTIKTFCKPTDSFY